MSDNFQNTIEKFGLHGELVAVATNEFEPGERFERWSTEVLAGVDLAKPQEFPGEFMATLTGVVTDDCEFYGLRSDPLSCRRTVRDIERTGTGTVSLIAPLTGTIHQHQDVEVSTNATPGNWSVFDTARQSDIGWERSEWLEFVLPREEVKRAIGGEIPAAATLEYALNSSKMGGLLRENLTLLMSHVEGLIPAQRVQMLNHTKHLALFTLSDAFGALDEGRPMRGGIVTAARRYICNQLQEPELNAALVAEAIGCSRATLYRAFSEQELSVHQVIRSERLKRARAILSCRQSSKSVTAVAFNCGFGSVRTFNRAFRDHFGCSPTQLRAKIHDPDGT
jgi:AraC family transcriptional regulator, positive regulator of tynA and feaB